MNIATEIERTIMEPIIVIPIQNPCHRYQATRGEPDEGSRAAYGDTEQETREELLSMEGAAEDARIESLERQLTESKETISSLNAYADRLDRQRTQLLTALTALREHHRSEYQSNAFIDAQADAAIAECRP